MDAVFVLTGMLMLAGVFGITRILEADQLVTRRRTVLVLLTLPALSGILDGIFNLSFFLIHSLGFGFALTSIAGFPVIGNILRRLPRWRGVGRWLIVAGPLTLALTLAYFATFSPTVKGSETGVAGLTERALVTEILLFYAVMGWHAFRTAAPSP